MLVLSRKVGESFIIGDDVTVTVVQISGHSVRIGIEAPLGSAVVRRELLYTGLERRAADGSPGTSSENEEQRAE